MNIPLSPCVPENLVSRDGLSRPVPRQPAHLHTQAESGAYLRDSSRVPRRCPIMKPPYAIGSVPSLSSHIVEASITQPQKSKMDGSESELNPKTVKYVGMLVLDVEREHHLLRQTHFKNRLHGCRTRGILKRLRHLPSELERKAPPHSICPLRDSSGQNFD